MSALRVILLVCINISISLVRPAAIQGRLSDMGVVSDTKNYVKPYIHSMQLGKETVYQKSLPAPTVEEAINDKVKELQPYLQDDDAEEHDKDGDKKSIEISRRNDDSMLTDMKTFKKTRKKIKSALRNEFVSHKTKRIVVKALDELVPAIMQKQCPQGLLLNKDLKKIVRSSMNILEGLKNVTYDSNNTCYINGEERGKGECKNLVEELTKDIANTLGEPYGKSLRTLDETSKEYILHEINEKYTMKCSLVDVESEFGKEYERENNILRKNVLRNDICPFFQVCSEELKEFLKAFHLSLNEVIEETCRNYARMYDKDILTDKTKEKNAVIGAIKHASDIAQKRVDQVFLKSTNDIKLDKNKDKKTNIAALQRLVNNTIKAVNETIYNRLENDLSTLKAKLIQAIKDDLLQHLDSDLDLFKSDTIQQICSFFMTCKGNPAKISLQISPNLSRKQFSAPKVKKKLKLDDNLRRAAISNLNELFRSEKMGTMNRKMEENSRRSNIVVTTTTTTETIKIKDVSPAEKLETPTTVESETSYEYEEEPDAQSLTIIVRK